MFGAWLVYLIGKRTLVAVLKYLKRAIIRALDVIDPD